MVLKRELFLLGLVFTACGSNDDATPDATLIDAGGDRVSAHPDVELVDAAPPADAAADTTVEMPDAACNVVVQTPPLEQAMHVPEGTVITYSTNPPSSGSHYPIWANFREYANPVADGYLVHSMEHGAVVLFYDCDPNACVAPPGVLDALRAVRNAVPTDPGCDPSIRVRIILAPRPANDVPIAAAAWGATYKADCVDAPSLSKFITDFYAKAPENFCSPGMEF
jgi:hypothetical protein